MNANWTLSRTKIKTLFKNLLKRHRRNNMEHAVNSQEQHVKSQEQLVNSQEQLVNSQEQPMNYQEPVNSLEQNENLSDQPANSLNQSVNYLSQPAIYSNEPEGKLLSSISRLMTCIEHVDKRENKLEAQVADLKNELSCGIDQVRNQQDELNDQIASLQNKLNVSIQDFTNRMEEKELQIDTLQNLLLANKDLYCHRKKELKFHIAYLNDYIHEEKKKTKDHLNDLKSRLWAYDNHTAHLKTLLQSAEQNIQTLKQENSELKQQMELQYDGDDYSTITQLNFKFKEVLAGRECGHKETEPVFKGVWPEKSIDEDCSTKSDADCEDN